MEHLDDMLGILLSGRCVDIALCYASRCMLRILLLVDVLKYLDDMLYYVEHLDDMLRILLLVDVLI